jgi:hypothetical protein
MSGNTNIAYKISVFLICGFSLLSVPVEAKSRYGHQTPQAAPTAKSIDDNWAELDNNWGYDYTLDPSEFGQGLYGVDGVDGFDGSGYGYGSYF